MAKENFKLLLIQDGDETKTRLGGHSKRNVNKGIKASMGRNDGICSMKHSMKQLYLLYLALAVGTGNFVYIQCIFLTLASQDSGSKQHQSILCFILKSKRTTWSCFDWNIFLKDREKVRGPHVDCSCFFVAVEILSWRSEICILWNENQSIKAKTYTAYYKQRFVLIYSPLDI